VTVTESDFVDSLDKWPAPVEYQLWISISSIDLVSVDASIPDGCSFVGDLAGGLSRR